MSERVASDRPIGLKMLAVVGLIALALGIGMSQSFELFRLSNTSYGARYLRGFGLCHFGEKVRPGRGECLVDPRPGTRSRIVRAFR
jgi:hypothetical protein